MSGMPTYLKVPKTTSTHQPKWKGIISTLGFAMPITWCLSKRFFCVKYISLIVEFITYCLVLASFWCPCRIYSLTYSKPLQVRLCWVFETQTSLVIFLVTWILRVVSYSIRGVEWDLVMFISLMNCWKIK